MAYRRKPLASSLLSGFSFLISSLASVDHVDLHNQAWQLSSTCYDDPQLSADQKSSVSGPLLLHKSKLVEYRIDQVCRLTEDCLPETLYEPAS